MPLRPPERRKLIVGHRIATGRHSCLMEPLATPARVPLREPQGPQGREDPRPAPDHGVLPRPRGRRRALVYTIATELHHAGKGCGYGTFGPITHEVGTRRSERRS